MHCSYKAESVGSSPTARTTLEKDMKQIIRLLLGITAAIQDFLERKLYTGTEPGQYGVYSAGEEWEGIERTRAVSSSSEIARYEDYLMSDPDIIIGSQVEHIHEEWIGEVVGLIFDEDGEVESVSVWLEDGDMVDDYIEYWDLIEAEILPDNIIEATNRFIKKI
tara:strand:- start:1631 stop:2122 length:492 start_codon:yes stop_codon:yes gene_type:complete